MRRTSIIAILALAAVTCRDATSPATPSGALIPRNSPSNDVSGTQTVFGPQACVRETGKPATVSFGFTGIVGTPATLKVADIGVQGLNGFIVFNGRPW